MGGLLGENDPDSQKCCEFCVTQSKHSPQAQSAFCFIAGSLIYYECPNHFDHSIKGQTASMLTKQWRQVLANEINKAKKSFHMNAVELLSHITKINKKTTKVMNVHDSLPKEKEKNH